MIINPQESTVFLVKYKKRHMMLYHHPNSYLYNRLFRNGEYPRSWGDGIIPPIFKTGDVNDAGNYRGITLINILAKIYSQLLLNRLTGWVEKYEK